MSRSPTEKHPDVTSIAKTCSQTLRDLPITNPVRSLLNAGWVAPMPFPESQRWTRPWGCASASPRLYRSRACDLVVKSVAMSARACLGWPLLCWNKLCRARKEGPGTGVSKRFRKYILHSMRHNYTHNTCSKVSKPWSWSFSFS